MAAASSSAPAPGEPKPVVFVQTPRNSDGSTGVRSSPVPDTKHEMMMQEFVHAQLMTILKPFVDQLEMLSDGLGSVTAQATEVEAEVLQHRDHIVQNQKQVESLDARATDAGKAIVILQKQVAQLASKHEVLAADHFGVKSSVAESDSQLKDSASQIERLLGGQDGIIASLDRLTSGLETSEQKQIVVEKRLDHLHQFSKDLRGEQTNQLESLREVHVKADRSTDAIRKANADVIRKQGEDDEKFACLNQHARGFEAKLSLYLGEFRHQEEVLKAHEKEFQRVAAQIAKIRDTEQLYAEFSELLLQVKEFNRRVAKLEDNFNQVAGRTNFDVSFFQDSIAKVQEQSEENTLKIAAVDRDKAASNQQVELLSKSLDHLQAAVQNTEHRATVLDGEIQDMNFWQHGATEKFEDLNIRLQSSKGEMAKFQKDLDAKGTAIHDVREDLMATQRRLARLDGNVDIMQKYFTGFGKGLQDTSRCVSSRDTFTTPRTSPQRPHSATVSTGLPSLPQPPDSPSRRRPWSSIERTHKDFDDL